VGVAVCVRVGGGLFIAVGGCMLPSLSGVVALSCSGVCYSSGLPCVGRVPVVVAFYFRRGTARVIWLQACMVRL
jgi:hypothetical protein